MTKEEIREKLKALQNRFNIMDLDDERIESDTKFILEDRDGNKRTEKEQESHIRYLTYEYYRELVKEYSHVVIAKNKSKRYRILIKRKSGKLYRCMEFFAGTNEERLPFIYKSAEALNKILDENCITGKVEFPTGEVIFANYFNNSACDNYAFDLPERKEYREENSINHSLGQQNTMKILSETHGLGYVQLGNTSAAIYKVSDDKIVMTSSYLDYYDREKEEEITLDIPESWEYLGTVSCDVWRVEFIDKQNFDKGDALPIDHEKYEFNKPFTGKVNPGTWKITNRYRYIDDGKEMKERRIPIWVELEREK